METLKDLREWVLADPEQRLISLQIADKYLVEYDRDPKFLVIPWEHSFAKPVVEAFANDPLAYAKWLKKLNNNHFERGSELGKSLTELSAKIQSRGLNQRRRAIESDALFSALKHGALKDTTLDKARWLKRFRDTVKREYEAHMKAFRSKTDKGRIKTEEREVIVAEYWEQMAQRAAAGEFNEL